MGFDVELAGRRALPQGAFDARRGQFLADALLGLALSVRAERVLAVTDVDLYARDLNFVFGVAQPSGEACVVSLFRLHLDADKERFRGRALKEAMHELGHTFGLGHCADPRCVMWFSNTLEETDRKGAVYYPGARRRSTWRAVQPEACSSANGGALQSRAPFRPRAHGSLPASC